MTIASSAVSKWLAFTLFASSLPIFLYWILITEAKVSCYLSSHTRFTVLIYLIFLAFIYLRVCKSLCRLPRYLITSVCFFKAQK